MFEQSFPFQNLITKHRQSDTFILSQKQSAELIDGGLSPNIRLEENNAATCDKPYYIHFVYIVNSIYTVILQHQQPAPIIHTRRAIVELRTRHPMHPRRYNINALRADGRPPARLLHILILPVPVRMDGRIAKAPPCHRYPPSTHWPE